MANDVKGFHLVDPNDRIDEKLKGTTISPDDLNIVVKLTANKRGRSAILVGDQYVRYFDEGNSNVNFIAGSKIGDEKHLTTHYTEIGTDFNKTNKGIETLGIENIRIDFNTSYAPMVVIDFVDVRGQIFTYGKESPYSVFFSLPYPTFELTVKGFYGKAVSYCLHLTKFSGKLNDQTGNFEIRCEFIGYTYAFLTDMILGYLKAAPYTTIGSQVADSLFPEGYTSFDTLFDSVKAVTTLIKKFKDNPQLQAIAKGQNVLLRLQQIKSEIGASLKTILDDNTFNYEGYVLGLKKSKIDGNFKTNLDKAKSTHNTKVKELLDKFNAEEPTLAFDVESFTINEKTKYTTLISKTVLGTSYEDYTNNVVGKINEGEKITEVQYQDFVDILNKSNVTNDQEIVVYYLKTGKDSIDEKISTLTKQLQATKVGVADALANEVNSAVSRATNGQFTPTIYNFFKILSDHIDIFIGAMKEVARNVELNPNTRISHLNNISGIKDALVTPDGAKIDNLGAWPDYFKIDSNDPNGAFADAWIGDDAPNLPEVVFVEEMLDGLVASKAKSNSLLDQINQLEVGWYPVNPLEVFNEFENPWRAIENNTHWEIARMMLSRSTLFFNSHRYFSQDEVIAMAKLEANNGYSNISNLSIKQAFGELYGSRNSKTNRDRLLNSATQGVFNGKQELLNDGAPVNNGAFYRKIDIPSTENLNGDAGTFFEYIYAPRLDGLSDSANDYNKKQTGILSIPTALPVYNTTADYSMNQYINASLDEAITQRNNGDLFVTNYIGANSNASGVKFDDGGTYVKILTPEKYKSLSNLTTPPYAVDILSSVTNKSTKIPYKYGDEVYSLWDRKQSPANVSIFSGTKGTAEFVEASTDSNQIIGDSSDYPVWVTFYGDNNRPFLSQSKKDVSEIIRPYYIRKSMIDSNGNFAGPISEIKYVRKDGDQYDIPTTIFMLYDSESRQNMYSHWNANGNQAGRNKKFAQDIYLDNEVEIPFIEYEVVPSVKIGGSQNSTSLPSKLTVSLFGSDLYYSQTSDEAKAFLFLHTIPFDGINSKIDGSGISEPDLFKIVSSYFDSRAGFVEVPYTWILFLGGLLKRDKLDFFVETANQNYSYILGVTNNEAGQLGAHQYMFPDIDNPEGLMFMNGADLNGDNSSYRPLSKLIDELPLQIKNEFIREFEEWVAGDWLNIKSQLEIFKDGTTRNERIEYFRKWVNIPVPTMSVSTLTSLYQDSILRDGVFNDYEVLQHDNQYGYRPNIMPFTQGNATTLSTQLQAANSVQTLENIANTFDVGSPFNFRVVVRSKSNLSTKLVDLIADTRVIANATWRPWASNVIGAEGVNDGFLNSGLNYLNYPFLVSEPNLRLYVETFFDEWNKLLNTEEESKKEETIKSQLFNSINNTDIKLKLYKNLKSIFDKWVAGYEGSTACNVTGNLIDHFLFIDRSYTDIKDKFVVNPVEMVRELESNFNKNFYEYIARVLADNNIDFIPLPSYIKYNDPNAIQELFEAYTYKEFVDESLNTTVGPQFVCMYIGERSSKLDLGGSSQYDNDTFDFTLPDTIPKDFNGTGDSIVPAFLVRYSDQNQSIFKNFKLDQSEFTETDESLQINSDIADRGGSTYATNLGQNLFDIYKVRSYSTEIEMLGNAQIQPFMYFQLNNVPMFHGAYTIIKVSHNIKPNYMSTTFKGVRIKKTIPKMVTAGTAYMNLLSSLSDIEISEGNIMDLLEATNLANSPEYQTDSPLDRPNSTTQTVATRPPWSGCITHKMRDNDGLKIQASGSTTIDTYTIKEIGDFMYNIGLKWNNFVKTNNKTYNDVLYYNDLSLYLGGDIKNHESHEKGLSMDVRAISKQKGSVPVDISASTKVNYSFEGTKELFKLLQQESINSSDWNNSAIKVIYFNDPNMIAEFSDTGFVKSSVGHENHFHIEFNLPKRVENDEVNDYMVCKETISDSPTPETFGTLSAKSIRGSVPSETARLQSLGKV